MQNDNKIITAALAQAQDLGLILSFACLPLNGWILLKDRKKMKMDKAANILKPNRWQNYK